MPLNRLDIQRIELMIEDRVKRLLPEIIKMIDDRLAEKNPEIRQLVVEELMTLATDPTIVWDGVKIHYTTGSSRTVEGSGRFQITDGGTNTLHITTGDGPSGEKVAQITIDTLS